MVKGYKILDLATLIADPKSINSQSRAATNVPKVPEKREKPDIDFNLDSIDNKRIRQNELETPQFTDRTLINPVEKQSGGYLIGSNYPSASNSRSFADIYDVEPKDAQLKRDLENSTSSRFDTYGQTSLEIPKSNVGIKPSIKVSSPSRHDDENIFKSYSMIYEPEENSRNRNTSDQSNNLSANFGIGEDQYSNTSRKSEWEFESDEEEEYQPIKTTRSRSKSRNASGAGSKANSRSASPSRNQKSRADSSVFVSQNKWSPLGKPTSTKTSVLLADKWSDRVNPKGWYMSEKLDGIRCYWTGSSMYSRNWNQYFPPKWFTEGWPNSPLDGELWIGRATFQKCVSTVRKKNPIDSEWRQVKYLVFDAPGLHEPFEERLRRTKEVIAKVNSPYLLLHPHEACQGLEHLRKELARVEAMGGEGLMLRDPKSFYEHRRSKTLLKVKTFHDDEAVVLAHEEGEGRNIGLCGALRVRNTAGVEFSVGSGLNDKDRKNPPKIGSKITYKYQSLSDRGIPRFPTYLRPYSDD